MKDIFTNSDHKVKDFQEWIEYVKHRGERYSEIQQHSDNIFTHLLETENLSDIQSPASVAATDKYTLFAKKSASPNKYPVSVTEGLQTIINLCRVASGYDPLEPEGNGNAQKFITFTEEIEKVPFLSLLWADKNTITQQSHDTDVLIDSFIEAFQGLSPQDKITIKVYLKKLIHTALSYADQKEKKSNLVQYALAKTPRGVSLLLYSSVLIIKKVDNKGTIKFTSHYNLSQAEYNLSQKIWEVARSVFEKEDKITIEYLIDCMTTKMKT